MSNLPEINADSVFAQIHQLGVVPVVTLDSLDAALSLAYALLACGLPIAEVTFRTAIAADVIRLLTRERPQLLVGAGTLVAAVGGTWIARKVDLAAGRWDEISQRCRAARETVARMRGSDKEPTGAASKAVSLASPLGSPAGL